MSSTSMSPTRGDESELAGRPVDSKVNERPRSRPLRRVARLFLFYALVGLYVKFVTNPMGFGDAGRYLTMAESPGKFVGSPWGYRIGVPYLIGGMSHLTGIPVRPLFFVFQLVVFATLLTLLFLWLTRAFDVDGFTAMLATFLFVFSFPGTYNLHNTVHVGLAEHLLVLIGCIAVYRGRFGRLITIVTLSVLVKESVAMLLVPTYFVVGMLLENRRSTLINTVLLIGGFLPLFGLLRSGILFHDPAGLGTYTAFYTWDYVRYVYHYWGGVVGAALWIANTFGPTWLLALAGLFVAPPRLKALSVLPVLATLQIVLATDVARMVGVAAPVLVALSAVALRRLDKVQGATLVALSISYFLWYNAFVGDIRLWNMAVAALHSVVAAGLLWHRVVLGIPAAVARLPAR